MVINELRQFGLYKAKSIAREISVFKIMLLYKNIFHIYLLFLTFVLLNAQIHKRVKGKRRKLGHQKSSQQQEQQNFHEVDALGDDFIDFGAQTGEHGQYSWHADFPLE